MAENKIVRIPIPVKVNLYLENPAIVCTKEYLIACSYGSPNINGLYEYSFATHEWQILPQNGLPIDFIYLQIVILKQNLIVHGMKQYEINRNVYRIFMGDLTQRPIRFWEMCTTETLESYYHRIATDGRDTFYTIATPSNAVDEQLNLIVHRIDTDNRLTKMFEKIVELPLQCYAVNNTPLEFVYDSTLYMFHLYPYGIHRQFLKLLAFNLRTSHASTGYLIDLQPANGPSPGFPCMDKFSQNISLVRCPVDPKHVYLIVNNHAHDSSWEVWRLDLTTMQWHSLLRNRIDSTPVLGASWITAAVTPFGRLYVLQSIRPFNRTFDDDSGILPGVARIGNRKRRLHDLFCASIREQNGAVESQHADDVEQLLNSTNLDDILWCLWVRLNHRRTQG